MRKVDSGSPFDLVVVCNGGDKAPLKLPSRFDDLRPRIFNRENLGYNIAAWEHGWRNAGDYEFFLFIQDDCFLKRRLWVSDFESRFDQDMGIGLLGEQIMYDQMTWDYVRLKTNAPFWGAPETWPEPVHPIDKYRSLFESRGLSWGAIATHLPSIILFSSRAILEEIGGFPYYGPSYREAIASELSISRLVETKGYRIGKVTNFNFELIGHPQWSESGKPRTPGFEGAFFEFLWRSRTMISLLLGNRNKAQRLYVEPKSSRDAQPVAADRSS